jgi:hypothetical protein
MNNGEFSVYSLQWLAWLLSVLFRYPQLFVSVGFLTEKRSRRAALSQQIGIRGRDSFQAFRLHRFDDLTVHACNRVNIFVTELKFFEVPRSSDHQSV